MKKKLTIFFACLLLCVGNTFAQTRTIRGSVVSSDDGQPIIGASVIVEGSKNGSATDAEGKFIISRVPDDAKSVKVSYIGYKTKTASISANMKIVLESDSHELNEVVVTAMGITREKKSLGYAVQDVKADKLTQGASSNLAEALQGKVSGIEITSSSGMPGASSKITIRGSRSFTGDNTPLYVVDGMPISSSYDISTSNISNSVEGADYASRSIDIDPNDIESINILKGQAASALYGMRASNGVVVITTKSGKGARSTKPEITYTSNLSFDVISTTPDFQTTYAQGAGGLYSPKASTSWGPKISELANDPNYGGNTDNKYTQKYGKQEGKYYVPQLAAAGLDPWATPQSYNNTDDFFRTGTTWSNSINVAQSVGKGHYDFALGNTTSNGIMRSTGMNRYNAKFSAEVALTDHWTSGFNGNFVTSKIKKQTSANNGIVATVYAAPPSYDLAGIPDHVENDLYTQNNYRGGTFDNAYWALDNNSFIERSQRFFGNAYVNYKTTFGTEDMKLNVKYQIGDDAYTTHYQDLWGYGHANGQGEATNRILTTNEFNSLLTANFDWKINSDLDFNAIIGNEFVHKTTKYNYEDGSTFNFPGWNHMNNATIYVTSESYGKYRTVGNFANLALSYKDMLFLNVTGRDDIVSSMPHGNRSFFYPSISAGFIFTELPALKNDVLTYGKIRASYAEVGEAGTYMENFYYTPAYGGGFSSGTPIQYPIGGIVAYTPYYKVYDKNLKPQNTKSYELGFDLGFWNGIVTLNYTFSRQNVKDQIFDIPMAASTGYSTLVTNGGSIHTNTHEFTLGIKPIDTKDFKWNMEFNFSKIDNYVDKLAEGVESIFLGGFTDPQVRAGIGDKFPVIYGTTFLRNDNGDIVVDENGMPQAGGEGVIGKVSPDFRLGFSTAFEIYKLRLSAVFDWKQGGQMYCGTAGVLDYYGVTKKSVEYREKESFLFEKAAVKQNADGTYSKNDILIPSSSAMDYFSILSDISEASIRDNSFVKLRELSLSYPVIEKPYLNITVNAFARNIIIWSQLKGLDPEATQGNDNMQGAFERFSLPGTSSYGLGFTIKF
jgi:TonB-linked SusC/RagA family outer membrane protein